MLKRVVLLLLLLSSYIVAAEKAYAWGYGDLVAETMNVVKYMFSIGEFKDIWKIAMLISLISAVIMMLTPNPDFLKLPKIFIISVGVYTLFVTAKIDVYIEDKSDNNNSRLITGVPWAVGKPFAFFSTLEYRLGAMYETATSIPNGMKYSNSGFMTPISIFSQATKHKIVSPNLYQNLNNYILECVMPDLENGYKDYRTLVYSDNVWSYLGNTSPSTFMLYSDINNSTSLVNCTTAYSNINTTLQNYVGIGGEGMEHLGKSLGMLSASATSSTLGVANQYLLNSSKTASQMLLQSAALNTFSESFRNYSSMNGADLDVSAFHSASASQAASAQMIVSGILGSQYIPVIKGVLTVIILGLTPILALMMITPMTQKVFFGYILILSWLVSWHFGDVILNHIMITKAQNALSVYGDIKMVTNGLMSSTTTDYINMAASMYWTIPTIALLIVTGFSLSAFSSLNNAMTSKLDRTASAVGGDMAKGNMNFGNVGHNTYSANKLDATASQVMGNAFRFDDLATFNQGNQANNYNSLSNTQGTQGFGGGLGESWSNSALSKDLGKGYSFGDGVQSTSAIGGGKHKATNEGTIQVTSSTGDNLSANVDSGNVYTKDSSGNLNLHSGKANFLDNGKSIEVEYKDGKEFKRSITDNQGNKMESTTMDNGIDKSFKWTSGQDTGTTISGIYNSKGNRIDEITDAKISGSDILKTNSGVQTFSAGETATLLKSADKNLMRSHTDSKDLASSINDKSDNILSEGTVNTSKASIGGDIGFLGLQSELAKNATSSTLDSVGKTLTVTDKEGKTESFSLSDREIKALQQAASSITSQTAGLNASRDINPERVKEISNQALNNGDDLNNTFKSIVTNKDSYHSGSIAKTNNGASTNFENLKENIANNYKDLDNRNLGISEDSKNKISAIEGKYNLKGGSIDNAIDAINKKIENGMSKEDVALLGGVAAAGLGAAYVSKDKIIEKLDRNGGNWDKTITELADSTEKVESALKNGKGGKGTEQAFKDLGLDNHAKEQGYVFNKDGSINSDKTKLAQNKISMDRELQTRYGVGNSNTNNNITAEQKGRELLIEAVDEKLKNATTPNEINHLNKFKDDIVSGKEINNKRMMTAGFGHSTTTPSGNFDFEKVGQNYISNNPHLKSNVNTNKTSVHESSSSNEQETKKGSNLRNISLGVAGTVAGTYAYGSLTKEGQNIVDGAMAVASGTAGALLTPTNLEDGSDKLPSANTPNPFLDNVKKSDQHKTTNKPTIDEK